MIWYLPSVFSGVTVAVDWARAEIRQYVILGGLSGDESSDTDGVWNFVKKTNTDILGMTVK